MDDIRPLLFPRILELRLFATEYCVYFVVAPNQFPLFADLSRLLPSPPFFLSLSKSSLVCLVVWGESILLLRG